MLFVEGESLVAHRSRSHCCTLTGIGERPDKWPDAAVLIRRMGRGAWILKVASAVSGSLGTALLQSDSKYTIIAPSFWSPVFGSASGLAAGQGAQ